MNTTLATNRPHEFLSEQSGLFRPLSGQASDEVERGRPAHIKLDEGLFLNTSNRELEQLRPVTIDNRDGAVGREGLVH